jgi:hypothetical protein
MPLSIAAILGAPNMAAPDRSGKPDSRSNLSYEKGGVLNTRGGYGDISLYLEVKIV